jgi:hypothetical protein
MTEDTPRHRTRTPSVEDIRVKALPMPVYIAAGEVANTCMRVCKRERMGMSETHRKVRKRRRPHFDAVYGKHYGVLRYAGLEGKHKHFQLSNRPAPR